MDVTLIYVLLGYLIGAAITFLGYIYYVKATRKWPYYSQLELELEVGWCIFSTLFWPLVWVMTPFHLVLSGLVKLAKYLLERE